MGFLKKLSCYGSRKCFRNNSFRRTILKTARCMEFYEASYREKAFHNAKEIGLDGLVVIGEMVHIEEQDICQN